MNFFNYKFIAIIKSIENFKREKGKGKLRVYQGDVFMSVSDKIKKALEDRRMLHPNDDYGIEKKLG